jgi:hypothetical protein
MRGNSFLDQGGALDLGSGDVFRKEIVETIVAELATESVGKEYLRGLAASFMHPGTQSHNGILAQRGTALSASFPGAANVGATT